jgi:hypothetical protein
VVNVNCLEDVDPAHLDRAPASFEGETTECAARAAQAQLDREVRFL